MKLLRDPLVHFLTYGAVLFTGHALWSAHVTRAERQLVVDTKEITRQSQLFALEQGRAPTDAELQGIILSFVEEEVLAREARRLGLDEDDTVVRRRLAQKMRLLSDSGAVPPPDEATLQAWFEARRDAYAVPERRAVEHVFFSDETRRDAGTDAAAADLSDPASAGDPFIIARAIPPTARLKLQQDYGGAFARAAFELAPGEWSAPVRSPFGVHRLRVTQLVPARKPDLDSRRADVLRDWTDAERERRAAKTLREQVARYDVVIEE